MVTAIKDKQPDAKIELQPEKQRSVNQQTNPPMQKDKDGYIVLGTPFHVDDSYEILKPIGQGAYGVVVAARIKDEEQKGTSATSDQAAGSNDAPDKECENSFDGIAGMSECTKGDDSHQS